MVEKKLKLVKNGFAKKVFWREIMLWWTEHETNV